MFISRRARRTQESICATKTREKAKRTDNLVTVVQIPPTGRERNRVKPQSKQANRHHNRQIVGIHQCQRGRSGVETR